MTTYQSHLQVRNLSAWYGDLQVLKNVSLEIPNNRITAVVGPSGCGKSTLLKCMNRLLEVNRAARIEGKVMVDGHDIYAADAEVPEIRRWMGLLAQRPQVLPMSIFENVAYGPRIHGLWNRGDFSRRVEEYLRMAGLWNEVNDRLHAPATGLSIGQQQRLCLARGLAVEPVVILGDEPTSALDPQSTRHVEERLADLKRKYTIVLVTHILRQARRMADHVVFFYMGEVIEAGPAQEVFENPRHPLTRQYMQGVIS
jgi:phosphate transport system ATP-binding protein